MKKEAFLNELRNRLSGLPQSDIEDRISFFGEMIDGRIEDGMSEEEAVAGMESVDAIVAQIMSEIPLARLVRNKVKPALSLRNITKTRTDPHPQHISIFPPSP